MSRKLQSFINQRSRQKHGPPARLDEEERRAEAAAKKKKRKRDDEDDDKRAAKKPKLEPQVIKVPRRQKKKAEFRKNFVMWHLPARMKQLFRHNQKCKEVACESDRLLSQTDMLLKEMSQRGWRLRGCVPPIDPLTAKCKDWVRVDGASVNPLLAMEARVDIEKLSAYQSLMYSPFKYGYTMCCYHGDIGITEAELLANGLDADPDEPCLRFALTKREPQLCNVHAYILGTLGCRFKMTDNKNLKHDFCGEQVIDDACLPGLPDDRRRFCPAHLRRQFGCAFVAPDGKTCDGSAEGHVSQRCASHRFGMQCSWMLNDGKEQCQNVVRVCKSCLK